MKPYGGVPALYINGKAESPVAYTSYHPSQEVFDSFAGSGVRLFSIMATPTDDVYGCA